MPSASSLHSRFKGDVPVEGTPMFVCGVNEQTYEGQTIAGNASSTTNCLAPVAQVLNDKWASNAAS